MDIEAQLNELKRKAEAAKRTQMSAEMARDLALKERAEALLVLQEEFGVETVDAAESLLVDLKGQLDAELKALEASLDALS